MPVSHRKEMAILQATEMRHRNPRILIHFVRVAWRLARLCGESKLGHAVRVHLFRVARVEAVFEGLGGCGGQGVLQQHLVSRLLWWGLWLGLSSWLDVRGLEQLVL